MSKTQDLLDSFVGCIEVHRDNWIAMAENAKDAGQAQLATEMLRMADGCENIIKLAKQKWGN